MGPEGRVAKVVAVDYDIGRAFIEYRNGTVSSFDPPEGNFQCGDILLISTDETNEDNSSVQKIPSSAWPDFHWIGVVKIKLSDITVIDGNGRFRIVPTNQSPNYKVDNTVLACEMEGVVRVLSEKPIKYIDFNAEIDEEAIDRFRRPIPEGYKLSFDDFGGLKPVVDRARELIELALQKRNELSEMGVPPIKGVLFTGEPGTGKTMLAQIIASQSGATFFEISGPAIFSKWYGESEELLRKIFERAEREDKAIIFIDEIDSVAAQRDDHSHEASKRIVGQLLTLMDGFTPSKNVIVIAATNRPGDLDDALLRPGRFDWEIKFPFPDETDREDILKKTARGKKVTGPLPHTEIAQMSDGWSGADLSAIWKEAALLAAKDKRNSICAEDFIGGFERVSLQKIDSK